MEQANINTSVDVKLNHNDMIEMLVEEQKELLETQILEKKGLLRKLENKKESIRAAINKEVLKKHNLSKGPEVKAYKKLLESMTYDFKEYVEVRWDLINGKDIGRLPSKMIGDITAKDLKRLKECLVRMEEGDNTNTVPFHHGEIREVIFTVEPHLFSKNRDKSNPLSVDVRVDPITVRYRLDENVKYAEANFKKLREAEITQFNERKDLFDLEMSLAELETSGKRHKAKFTKAMLRNSETGQQLLNIMGKVGGTNLLQAGQDSPD